MNLTVHNHIGILLMIITFMYCLYLIDNDLLNRYSLVWPFVVSLVIFVAFEAFYWIITYFFIYN